MWETFATWVDELAEGFLSMKHTRHISYATCSAIILTAVSHIFYRQGGELLALPGLTIHIILNGAMLFIFPFDGCDCSLPSGAYLIFNVAFYSGVFFVLLLLIENIKTAKKK